MQQDSETAEQAFGQIAAWIDEQVAQTAEEEPDEARGAELRTLRELVARMGRAVRRERNELRASHHTELTALRRTTVPVDQFDALNQRHGALARESDQLRLSHRDLTKAYDQLVRNRDELLQEREILLDRLREKGIAEARGRGAVMDDDRRRHQDHITAYQRIVEYRVPEVVAEVCRFPRKLREPYRQLRWEARAVQVLVQALFERSGDFFAGRRLTADDLATISHHLVAWLQRHEIETTKPPHPKLGALIHDVGALHEAIRANKYPASFVTTMPVAELAVPQTARLWPSCVSNGLFEFVVAPAYVVEGGPVDLPWVFLGARE
ncbi:hypothetical protein [Luedemannella helvata]|uniref:hypothetical protein n=1 Tax=Luedemannella helvata TaxID=349315 RepID=UPI0031DA3B6A